MVKHFKYLKYLLKHKWYVGVALVKEGYFLRAITHDLSKFLPSEWVPYTNYFYGDMFERDEGSFNNAWRLHIKRNKHHWQHYCLIKDSGDIITLEMPYDDMMEMLCDWTGAGISKNGYNDIVKFWNNNKLNILLHPKTRRLVEEYIAEVELEQSLTFNL